MSLSLSPNTIIPATSLFCCVAPSSNGIDVNFLIRKCCALLLRFLRKRLIGETYFYSICQLPHKE